MPNKMLKYILEEKWRMLGLVLQALLSVYIVSSCTESNFDVIVLQKCIDSLLSRVLTRLVSRILFITPVNLFIGCYACCWYQI
jgi:hypothetical protein